MSLVNYHIIHLIAQLAHAGIGGDASPAGAADTLDEGELSWNVRPWEKGEAAGLA